MLQIPRALYEISQAREPNEGLPSLEGMEVAQDSLDPFHGFKTVSRRHHPSIMRFIPGLRDEGFHSLGSIGILPRRLFNCSR